MPSNGESKGEERVVIFIQGGKGLGKELPQRSLKQGAEGRRAAQIATKEIEKQNPLTRLYPPAPAFFRCLSWNA